MKWRIVLRVGFILFLQCIIFDTMGQYRIYDSGDVLAPMPGGGVAVISSDDGYLSAINTYDEFGRKSSIPISNLRRVGDAGDFAFTGDEIYYLPGYWEDFDLIQNLSISGISINRDSAVLNFSLNEDSPIQYPWQRSIGLSKDGKQKVVAGSDSVFIFSDAGQVVEELELTQEFGRSVVIDIDGTNLSSDYVVAGLTNYLTVGASATLHFFEADGTLLSTKLFNGNLLGDWTNNGRAFFFLNNGYVELGVDTLNLYPPEIGRINSAYDAEDVAVVQTDVGKSFSFDPAVGFVPVNLSGFFGSDFVVKRSEGWYSLLQGILTYSPDSILAPITNPLSIFNAIDSANSNIEYDGQNNVVSTSYIVYYKLFIENTADTTVPQATITILGDVGSYDPADPSDSYDYVNIGPLAPAETIEYSGEYAYRIIGSIPIPRARINACILSVNGQRFVGGQTACRRIGTRIVSDIDELSTSAPNAVVVYPNPVSQSFSIESDRIVSSMRLVNPVGQVVQEFEGQLSKTYLLSNIVSSGLYTLNVYLGNGDMETLKMLIHQ